MSPCDLLVVAAFPPELAPLRDALGEGLRRQVGGHDVAAKAVGIGLPTAAAGAAARLIALRPRAVIMVGTCGGYDRAIPIGGVAIARLVVLADSAVAYERAAYPEPMSTECTAAPALATALAAHGGAIVDVATTLAVTTDDTFAARLAASTGCQAEHLEAYGVAAACAAEGIAFAAALGVANAVGARGREEWRLNHRAASAAAVALVLAWLRAGGAGIPSRA